MTDNISHIALLHLLTKKNIITVEEAKDLRGISYLQKLLQDKGVIVGVDLEIMENIYSKIVVLVRGYLTSKEKEQREDIIVNLEKVLGEL